MIFCSKKSYTCSLRCLFARRRRKLIRREVWGGSGQYISGFIMRQPAPQRDGREPPRRRTQKSPGALGSRYVQMLAQVIIKILFYCRQNCVRIQYWFWGSKWFLFAIFLIFKMNFVRWSVLIPRYKLRPPFCPMVETCERAIDASTGCFWRETAQQAPSEHLFICLRRVRPVPS